MLLEDRYPNTEFEVICVAASAINSHVILPIAREVARLDGDLWVIYMGNNEMVGPFGAGTIFGAKACPYQSCPQNDASGPIDGKFHLEPGFEFRGS